MTTLEEALAVGQALLQADRERASLQRDTEEAERQASWQKMLGAARTAYPYLAQLLPTSLEDYPEFTTTGELKLWLQPFGAVAITMEMYFSHQDGWHIARLNPFRVQQCFRADDSETEEGYYPLCSAWYQTDSMPLALALAQQAEAEYTACLEECRRRNAARQPAPAPAVPELVPWLSNLQEIAAAFSQEDFLVQRHLNGKIDWVESCTPHGASYCACWREARIFRGQEAALEWLMPGYSLIFRKALPG